MPANEGEHSISVDGPTPKRKGDEAASIHAVSSFHKIFHSGTFKERTKRGQEEDVTIAQGVI